jgi:Xaa-Pro aminopeptidase
MKPLRLVALALLAASAAVPALRALEKQPASVYHARRLALSAKLHGGVAILFAAEEPLLDFMPYRQDEDFYYLTGWSEPGAAVVIFGNGQEGQTPPTGQSNIVALPYTEILFLPTRDLRMEKYTGVKLDAATPGAPQTAGVDAVQPMTDLPAVLNRLFEKNRGLAYNLWTQPLAPQAKDLVGFTATTLGMGAAPSTHDVTGPSAELRVVKDAGEIDLLKKASTASIEAQRVMMRAVKPGTTERAIAGK